MLTAKVAGIGLIAIAILIEAISSEVGVGSALFIAGNVWLAFDWFRWAIFESIVIRRMEADEEYERNREEDA